MTNLVWLERVLLIIVRSMPARIWHSLLLKREREKLISSTRKVVDWPTLHSSRFMEYEIDHFNTTFLYSCATPLFSHATLMTCAVWPCVAFREKVKKQRFFHSFPPLSPTITITHPLSYHHTIPLTSAHTLLPQPLVPLSSRSHKIGSKKMSKLPFFAPRLRKSEVWISTTNVQVANLTISHNISLEEHLTL